MRKITIIQKDSDGKAARTFTRWVKLGDVQHTLNRIREAYNMDHTEVFVTFG